MTAQESSAEITKPRKRFRWKMLIYTPLIIYGCYLLLAVFFQHYAIFPRFAATGNPDRIPNYEKAKKLELQGESGPVTAWYFPVDGAQTCVLIAYGNSEMASNWFGRAEDLVEMGMAAVILEYPGYGKAEGSPTQKTIGAALDATYDHIVGLGFQGEKIVGLGYSIGTGTICDLSMRKEMGALVLIAPFKSMKAMFHRFLTPSFLLRSPFDNVAALKQFKGPVLIFHGTEDALIPHAHAEHLASLNERYNLVSLKADHVDIHQFWYSKILPKISDFYQRATR